MPNIANEIIYAYHFSLSDDICHSSGSSVKFMKILAMIEFRSPLYHIVALKGAILVQSNPTFITFCNVSVCLVLKHNMAPSSDLDIHVIFGKWASFGGCPPNTKWTRKPQIRLQCFERKLFQMLPNMAMCNNHIYPVLRTYWTPLVHYVQPERQN